MSHYKRRLQIFHYPGLPWYLASATLACFGSGLNYIATLWLLLKHNNAIDAAALLMICFWFPSVLAGPLCGVLADRYSRKRLIISTNLIRALTLFVFGLFMSDYTTNHVIYIMVIINSLVFALYLPSAMAFIRELVPKDDLLNANTAIDIAYEFGNICGMGAAGVVIALTSIKATFLINAACFLVSTFFFFYIPNSSAGNVKAVVTQKITTIIYKDFVAGVAYLRQNRLLIATYSIQLLIFVSFMTAPVILGPFAKNVLHTDVGQFGGIEAALSVGIVVGGLFSPYFIEKFGMERILLVEIIGLAVCFYFFKDNTKIMYADILYFLIGFCYACWPAIITRAQEMTDLDYQGRVQSIFNSFSGIVILLIYTLIYNVGHDFSLAHLYWVEVILAAIAILLILLQRRLAID